jgi:hypothetical protein
VGAHNVTHQGSQPGAVSAPLQAWTHDITTVDVAGTAADITAPSAPQGPDIATPANCWACCRCGARQPAALRQGFLRHSLQGRRRHDHCP